ncbi:acyltransferase family protein [Ruminococcus albus]|uniref:Surface polysaccharide O-acyltransferase, integral membrane enzyme n=1 Tax=Ruminococcus albus TaxID=1264 RepID=A0A1I1CUU7_RUMAL|nr:acyltransferase family protein [Ruminococcus albus]SFB66317.1 Surface polysaccharide O-acyltransferase, integral membrane enzyme [Ruminococcus albus]
MNNTTLNQYNKLISDEKISCTVYIIRVFAILSVIAAHVNVVDNSNIISSIITHIWAILSCFGVPAFLITGGYYYHRKKNDSKIFWKKKVFGFIIPWIIASIITYFIHIFLGEHDGSLFDYFLWFIGSKTFFYYMTIYIFMLLLFKIINNNTLILIVCILVSIISLMFEQFFFKEDYGDLILTCYLNPLNWVGYFSFGIIVRNFNLEQKVTNRIFIISTCVFVVSFCIQSFFNQLSYFNILNPITQTALLVILFRVLTQHSSENKKMNKLLIFVSSNTLIIYFYHIQIVQFLLIRLRKNCLFKLFNPILGLIIMIAILYIAYFLAGRIPYGKVFMRYIGLKESNMKNLRKT